MNQSFNSVRGVNREAGLGRNAYFSEGYFSLKQLCSFAHQINHIHALRPRRMLEVGMGNGFVSTYLRNAGVSVITADINPSLLPDFCCNLTDLPSMLNEKFDLVSCCEVLEHMPWDQFENNIKTIRKYSNTLFLTLPYGRRRLGLGGFIGIPLLSRRSISVYIDAPFLKKNLPSEHYWEINYSRETSIRNILAILRRYYPKVRTGCFDLNPCHQFFVCKP
jgi:hypothetical protein